MALAVPSTSTNTATGTSLAINKPSGVVDGDLMIAAFYVGHQSTTITPPAGWTEIQSTAQGSHQIATYYKIASSEGSSYTWSVGASYLLRGGILRITGHTSSVIDVSTENVVNDNANPSFATGLTPTYANSLLIFVVGLEDTTTWSVSNYAIGTSSPSWTEAFELGSGTFWGLALAYAIRPETTALGNASVSIADPNTDTSFNFIVIPPRVDATVNLDVATLTATPNSMATITGGASVTLDVATITATPNALAAAAAAPKWVNADKSATSSLTNTDKS